MVTSKEYKAIVQQAELFLSGKQTELMKQLMEQIQKYSDTEQFEKAARLRDSYFDLQKTLEKQKVVYENTKLNEDIISLQHEDGILAIVIMMIREGRLIDKKDFTYEVEEEDKTEFLKHFSKNTTILCLWNFQIELFQTSLKPLVIRLCMKNGSK